MQSPLIVALRALIMLSALFAFPLFALQGGKVPEEVWKVAELVELRVAAMLEQRAVAQAPTEIPPLELPLRQPIVQASHMSSRAATTMEAHDPPRTRELIATMPITPVSVVSVVEPVGIANLATPQTGAAKEASRQRAVERRLRELGATSYALEKWGSDGKLYRFQSEVAVHDDPNFHRNFQAIAADPLLAMREVLDQIERWRRTAR